MIVKKVPTSKRAPAKSMAHNVRALVDYISGPSAGGDGEKVEHRGAENLLNVDHGEQVEEMIDLAEVAQRSPQPVQHWIISWREGEQPTAAQADAAVATFLDEMGLAEHQVIYALHRDTKNCHLHLAVNRVHPDTEKAVTVNNGFDHEVAHRAIARIERDQGWQREDRALFLARPDGQLERSRPRGGIKRQPSGPARDFEERVGERSAQRIALEVAAPIIREARSWNEMHGALAREGIRFERKGSGAILRIGNEAVKASSAGRECSMTALEKRFGELTVEQRLPQVPAIAPQPVERAPSRWATYAQERARHHEERTENRERVRDQQRDGWRRMADRQRRERDDILGGSWRGRAELRARDLREQMIGRRLRTPPARRNRPLHGASGALEDVRP
jgi:Relaxase/Mobilisation nuclease domain